MKLKAKTLSSIYFFILPLYTLAANPPTQVTASPSIVCLGSDVELTATCSSGTLTWFASGVTRTSLGTGSPLVVTPSASGAITYHATCTDVAGESSREPANSIEVVTSFDPPTALYPATGTIVDMCNSEKRVMSANCNAGRARWYNASNATSAVNAGPTLAYQYSNTATSYFVACEQDACISSRLQTGSINKRPTVGGSFAIDDICDGASTVTTSTSNPGINATYLWTKNASFMVKAVSTYLTGINVNDVNVLLGNIVLVATNQGLSISGNGGGTFTLKTTSNGLPSNNVKCIAVDDNYRQYVGTDNGLAISDDGGSTFQAIGVSNGLLGLDVQDIFVDKGAVIYVGTTTGLGVSYDGGSSFLFYTTANGLTDNNVRKIVRGGFSTNLYIATANGISVAPLNLSGFASITTTNSSGLQSNNIKAIETEPLSEGLIVAVASTNPVKYSGLTTSSFSSVSMVTAPFISRTINGSSQLRRNNMVALASDGGIHLIYEGQWLQLIDTNDGLPVSEIKNVFFDDEANLWGCTQSGLFKVEFENSASLTPNAISSTDLFRSYFSNSPETCNFSSYFDTKQLAAPVAQPSSANLIEVLPCANGGQLRFTGACPAGAITFYSSLSPNSAISSGVSPYNHPIAITAQYFASCRASNGCESTRLNLGTGNAYTVANATNVSIDKTEVCEGETVTLTANCPSGALVEWYPVQNGFGSFYLTGSPKTHVTVSTSDTYYAQCTDFSINGCKSFSRVATPSLTFKPQAEAITVNYQSDITNNTDQLAGSFINGTGTVNTGLSTTFKSGNAISLLPGFEALGGTVFQGLIEQQCTNPSTPSVVTK